MAQGRSPIEPLPAYRGEQPYVFVSYAHRDEAPAFREIRRLQDLGLNVYYDAGIGPGSEWSESLARAIRGCERFVYLVTPRSAQSENCRRELNFALETERPVLAVHLEPTELPDGIRLNLNNRQAILAHRLSEAAYQARLFEFFEGSTGDAEAVPAGPAPARRRYPRVLALGGVLLALVGGVVYLGSSWHDTAPGRPQAVVAVLPLEDVSAGEGDRELLDGLGIEINNQLAKVADLRVLARSAVLQSLKAGMVGIDAGARLGATHVLEGSFRFSRDRIRVTAHLVDVSNLQQVWTSAYDRDPGDYLSLQSDIAVAIADALGSRLSGAERGRIEAPLTDDLVAYRLYQRASPFNLVEGIPAQNRLAIQLLEEALALDPQFVAAMAWLAVRHTWEVRNGDPSAAEPARRHAERAVALDPESALAHYAMGIVHTAPWRLRVALQHYREAVARAPSDARILSEYSLLAGQLAQLEASLSAGLESVKAAPNDADKRWVLAVALRRLGDHQRARAWLQLALHELTEEGPAHIRLTAAQGWIGVAEGNTALPFTMDDLKDSPFANAAILKPAIASRLLVAGEWALARDWLSEIAAENPSQRHGNDDVPLERSVGTQYAFALLKLGERQSARELFEDRARSLSKGHEQGFDYPGITLELAAIHAALGEPDRALRWLDAAYDAGIREYRYLRIDPMFASLEGDERFDVRLERMQADVERQHANARRLGLLDDIDIMLAEGVLPR